MFILVQRPYGIGDRINISNAQTDAPGSGSQGWIVDDVTLFTTTIYLAGTNERATISNGTLASSRIINCARSPKAVIVLSVKFGVDVPFKRTEVFKSTVEKFVKSRPREWLSLIAIRASTVEADLGYVEYAIALQHRESWYVFRRGPVRQAVDDCGYEVVSNMLRSRQNIGPILDSKSIIMRFMLELTKKLELRYKAPALPIEMGGGFENTPLFQRSSTTPSMPPSDVAFLERARGGSLDIPTLSQRSTGSNLENKAQEVLAMFARKKPTLVVHAIDAE